MDSIERAKADLTLLREKLDSGRMRSARIMVNSLHPAEVARLLESLPLKDRAVLWELVDSEIEGDVLVELAGWARSS
jgi:magnesium transporter